MAEILLPRAAGKFIASIAKDVKISQEGIQKMSVKILDAIRMKRMGPWTYKEAYVHPSVADDKALDWIFLIDTLNFSFWTLDNQMKWTVTWKGQPQTGYFALCAAVNRAIDEGLDITKPSVYVNVSREQLEHVFRSDTSVNIPLLDERIRILKETGKVLQEQFEGSFVNCIKACDGSAQQLVALIVKNFPSYRDEATIEGKRVAFYKRAQILVSDIWACFEGIGHGEFKDIDEITMFSDYRVPQALAYFGVLEYSERLLKIMKAGEVLNNGDCLEVELRGCAIFATELIVEEVRKNIKSSHPDLSDAIVNACLVDYYLWDIRREFAKEMDTIPFHKVRCFYY